MNGVGAPLIIADLNDPMARLNPYSLRMELTRMVEQGQVFFTIPRVEDWLREHHLDPTEYDIGLVEEMAPPESGRVKLIRVDLKRRDGQPVDPGVLEEINHDT